MSYFEIVMFPLAGRRLMGQKSQFPQKMQLLKQRVLVHVGYCLYPSIPAQCLV
jgi:hypothetical protein